MSPPLSFGNPELPFTPDEFKFFADGTFMTTLSTFSSGVTFTYRVTAGDYKSENLVAEILPNNDVSVLTKPKVLGEGGDITFLEIYAINIENSFYPAYQFLLGAAHKVVGDRGCAEKHWHKYDGNAFPIGEPATEGIEDPKKNSCGYGTLTQLPLIKITTTKKVWDAFVAAHPFPQ